MADTSLQALAAAGEVEPAPAGMYRRNWSLLFGALIVLAVCAVAAFGPALAPRDPLKTNAILRVGNDWVSPPFPPLTVPGFPLGSDELGRDLLSRLLCGVRPTMITVLVSAALRLLLGTLIGLAAGWARGRLERALSGLIFGALAIPVLIIALAAIAALQVGIGIWAFVLGLSLTGWAETARLVAEQTRGVRGLAYVEAARALGLGSVRLLRRHVLRQIMPMLWMLSAFEISGTLLATASLGFLGYYTGGDAWIEVTDFSAMRVAGRPDLGQLLSGTAQVYTNPWGVAAAGLVVFVTVLGFNLLGEGLRLQLSPERTRRRTRLTRAAEAVSEWSGAHVWRPLETGLGRPGVRLALAGAAVALAGGGVAWWRLQTAPLKPAAEIVVPGGHPWATERHDAQGTLWTPALGPASTTVLWTFRAGEGLSGGPVVAAGGTLYVAGLDRRLYALTPDGRVRWSSSLPAEPCGSPALDAAGRIYVADAHAGLTAFSPEGVQLWHYEFVPDLGYSGFSSPLVAPDGMIYFVVNLRWVEAVSPDGHERWLGSTDVMPDTAAPLRLAPLGDYLLMQNVVLDTNGGAVARMPPLSGKESLLVGADGRLYFRVNNGLTEWRPSPQGAQLGRTVTWELAGFSNETPRDLGVTPNGIAWFLYANRYQDARLMWVDLATQTVTRAGFPHRETRVIGVDGQGTMYVCGLNRPLLQPQCLGFAPGTAEPRWTAVLPQGGEDVAGGALVQGRLYVALSEGTLYAIGQ